MRRLAQVAFTVLLLPALIFAQYHGKKEELPQPRTLSGTILNAGGQPAVGATVYLTNRRNLAVSTYLAAKDGSYRFNNLSPDADYQVQAEYQGHKSAAKSISAFDTHTQVRINLKLK